MFFMILYEQSHVLNELIRINDSLCDKIEKQRRSDTCCLRLLLVGQTDFGSRSLNGLGNSEDSGGHVKLMQLSMDGKAKEYPIQFPNKLEIELDISFIYNQLKIKGTMETTGYNGFTPSDYTEELYRDAKVNAQRKQRLQRRLDNLVREQQQNLKHQMKQRIFKAGIEYYEARAEYCHYLAESAYDTEFKIWTDIMLDFMAELDRQTENKTESPV